MRKPQDWAQPCPNPEGTHYRRMQQGNVSAIAMWNVIECKPAHEMDQAGESVPDGADGRQWIWGSFAPEFRLMIAAVVGPRRRDMLM